MALPTSAIRQRGVVEYKKSGETRRILIGNHSFRATGITTYLSNDGTLEHAQEIATHETLRTTKLYDRTKERLTQGENGENPVLTGDRVT